MAAERGRAHVRVRAPEGRQVPERRSRHRGGRQVLLRALPRRQRHAAQGEGGGGRDRGSASRALPPQAALARFHDLLRDPRHRRRVDSSEEVRRESRRRGLQARAGRRGAVPACLVQARRRARAGGLPRLLAQGARHQDPRVQGHPGRRDAAGCAEDRRSRRCLRDRGHARGRGQAHAGARPQGGEDPRDELDGLRRPGGSEVAVARPAGEARRELECQPRGHQ